MEHVARSNKPFKESEIVLLKNFVNSQWDLYKIKIDNLAAEVFDEVLEYEMALAGLDVMKFEDAIPKSTKLKTQKSLLVRMTTLKDSLIQK